MTPAGGVTVDRVVAPVFIVGCGRSGTTAFGSGVGRHPDLTYLNEPRRIWSIDPRTDVWTADAGGRGVLDLYARDASDDVLERLHGAFAARLRPGTRMVEKTPINSFRIGYLRALFTDATFVHLVRNGLDVAASIERWCRSGKPWYGHGDVKWHRLGEYASRQGLGELVAACGNQPRLRGLLEWRLAVSHIRTHAPDALEVRYEDLVRTPDVVLARVFAHVGVPPFSDTVDGFTQRPGQQPPRQPDEVERLIAGDLVGELA